MTEKSEFVTLAHCDARHKAMRGQIALIMTFFGFVIIGFTWSIIASYSVEKRFNIHEAVEVERDKHISSELKAIKEIGAEIKNEIKSKHE